MLTRTMKHPVTYSLVLVGLALTFLLLASSATSAQDNAAYVQPAAPAVAGYTSTLVQTIDTSLWSPPSPDPAGIAYRPSTNQLLISDSEVEEIVSGITHWQGANLFDATLTGTLVYTGDTTGYSKEPTGVAINPGNDHLFVSDDDKDEIYQLDPGLDGRYGTADDGVTSFDTHASGNTDPAGVAFGQGHVFVADGVGAEVYRYTSAGSLVSHFDVQSLGLTNPAGIDYNSDDETLFIIDLNTELVAETTISGTAVLMIDIQAANPHNPSSVAYAPRSTNPALKSLYVADRVVDNNADPNAIDGKVYELSAALPPVLVFSQPSYTVTESGGTATFTVNLFRRSSTATFNVNYATSNGTATAGSDYTATSGTLTFTGPSETSKTFSVPIANDLLDELDETLNLSLSSPTSGAVLGATSGVTLTITDNDIPPVVQFNSSAYNVNEAAGTAPITVTLSAASGLTVTVNYTATNGTATAGTDYTATSGTLTFDPGQTSQTFNVPITNDALDEANETVGLTLGNPGNATLGAPASATLTIADNDAPPTVQLSSATYSIDEGGGTAPITVTLSAASELTVTVNYATSNGTATAGVDYTATSGTLTFAPGQLGKTFSVPITNDALHEANETVNLTLSNPGNATLGAPASATLTLVDNDADPGVQFSAATYSVAEDGGTATITVTLSATSSHTVTVDYATSNGTATAGVDYTASSGTLTFDPGQTSQTFGVPILDDALHEANETVNLALSNPGNAVLGTPASATLSIVDNEGQPSVQFSTATYSVAEDGGTATITVTLSATSPHTVTVNYATSNGTATAGVDYTAMSGTLTFAPGQTSKSFGVPILNDALHELDETVNLTLSNPGSATLGTPASATLTIVEDDPVRIFLPLISRQT